MADLFDLFPPSRTRRRKPVVLDDAVIGEAAYWIDVLTILENHFEHEAAAMILIQGCSQTAEGFICHSSKGTSAHAIQPSRAAVRR